MDDLGGGEQSQDPQVQRQADVTDLLEQDRGALRMEKFGKCHKVKPESGAGSYMHTLLEPSAGDWPAEVRQRSASRCD